MTWYIYCTGIGSLQWLERECRGIGTLYFCDTLSSEISVTGKQILDRRYEELKDAISSGTVDETKAVGRS